MGSPDAPPVAGAPTAAAVARAARPARPAKAAPTRLTLSRRRSSPAPDTGLVTPEYPVTRLTEREVRLALMRLKGQTVAEIAETAGLPDRTVSLHLGNVYDVLQLHQFEPSGRRLALAGHLSTLRQAIEAGHELEPADAVRAPTPRALLAVIEDEAHFERRDVAGAPSFGWGGPRALLPAPAAPPPSPPARERRRPGAMLVLRAVAGVLVAALLVREVAGPLGGAAGPFGSTAAGGAGSEREAQPDREASRAALGPAGPSPSTALSGVSAAPAETAGEEPLPFGRAWTGEGLKLTALPARSGGAGGTAPLAVADFVVENSGPHVLELSVLYSVFYLETGYGRRFAGRAGSGSGSDRITFESLRPGEKRSFRVAFSTWEEFLELTRGGRDAFTVGARGFSARLPAVAWRGELDH